MSIKTFICYSHRDQKLLEKLRSHLMPLQYQGYIQMMYDRDIHAGANWGEEITEYLNTSQLILLLISSDFIASPYCYSVELAHVLERHAAQEVHVIPIILRPTDWENTPIGILQVLPANARPITRWSPQDEGYLDVAKGIRHTIYKQFARNADTSSPAVPSLNQIDKEILINSGDTYYRAGRYHEALNAYEQALRIDPRDAMVLTSKSYTLLHLRRFKEALKAYDQAFELDHTIRSFSQGRNRAAIYHYTPRIITTILAIFILLSSVVGITGYTRQQALLASSTATVVAEAHSTATAIAGVQNATTATAVASSYPFSNHLVVNDPMVDNSKGLNWDNTQAQGCFFSGGTYHVVEDTAHYYNTCAAQNSNYDNFTFQTEMVIKSGNNGASGGLIFRAHENSSQYYLLSIESNGNYFIQIVFNATGSDSRILEKNTASSFHTGIGEKNILAIVARGNQVTFYVNQQVVTTFSDDTYTFGQIGFDVVYGSSKTEVIFSNTKVWVL